jgi:uncharacterized membrane protein YcaP (DUF421 family)
MSDIWVLGVPAGEKVLRTVVVYAALALLLRVAGKRNLAQLNSFDLVVVLLLSNVVQNALIGPDDSVTGGLLAAVVLLATNALVVRAVSRSERAVRLFEGEDVALVRDGRFLDHSLRKEGLRRADVEAALRSQGADGAGDVAEASLSPGGSIVVWLKAQRMSANRADVDAIHRRLDAIQQAIERVAAGLAQEPPGSAR